jgi:hypothetical protein
VGSEIRVDATAGERTAAVMNETDDRKTPAQVDVRTARLSRAKDAREARLAAALRANLRRRKTPATSGAKPPLALLCDQD